MMTNLDFLRADHVGGLPRPAWLRDRQARFQRGEIGAAELEEDHRTAVAGLVRRQQDIGLGVLTDGEVARRNFQESFGGAVTGYDALPYEYPRIVPGASGRTRRPARSPDAVPTVRAPSGMASSGPPVLHRRPAAERLELARNVILEEYLRTSATASASAVAPEQVALCPRCGFGASNSGEDVVWRKLALIREVADETWR